METAADSVVVIHNNLLGCNNLEEVLTACIKTNITEKLLDNITIFPNPARERLTLQSTHAIKSKVRLIALDGKEVYNSDYAELNHEINITNLSKGIYFLHLLQENGYLVQKISVQ